MFESKTCKKCNGTGFIPEYKHIQNGICFSCWGTGQRIFNTYYPELNKLLKEQIVNDKFTSKQKEFIEEVASLCQSYNDYNSYLKIAETEEDQDGVLYYDIKMNEVISKLYSLSNQLKENVILIDNR